jgi:hypothetical protein
MEQNVLEPKYDFWQVTVAVETEIEDGKGNVKTKTVKEVHLIDGVNLQDVEKKLAESMAGTMYEWKVASATRSKIRYVY